MIWISPDSLPILEWKQISLWEKIGALVQLVKRALDETPAQNTRTINKLARWLTDLEYVIESMMRIRKEFLPRMIDVFGPKSVDEEILLVAMFQPSTKNLFIEIETHFEGNPEVILDKSEFHTLVSLGEMSKILALIGDTSISMAALHYLLKEDLAEVGDITQRRASIVSNENMAELCDSWGLYELRVHFDPPVSERSEMEHIKGTLIEAVYGMAYLLGGLKRVTDLITYLM